MNAHMPLITFFAVNVIVLLLSSQHQIGSSDANGPYGLYGLYGLSGFGSLTSGK